MAADALQPQVITEAIRSAIPTPWAIDDLVLCSENIARRFPSLNSDDQIISTSVDLVATSFSPSTSQGLEQVRDICAVMTVLALLARISPDQDGIYKATVASLYASNDILKDLPLTIEFCERIQPIAKANNIWKVLIIVIGDKGIALARAERFEKALLCIEEAVTLSIEHGEHSFTAKYLNEAGRCYYALDQLTKAEESLMSALEITKSLNDKELHAEILTTLKVFRKALGALN